MISPVKAHKLAACLKRFADDLALHKDFRVHRRINQFYYMQKSEEIKVLLEQLDASPEKSETVAWRIHETYVRAYFRWKEDVRWLRAHLISQGQPKTVL